MNWSERLTVLTGVAKAVHYLHTGVIPGFFSNRLKTNNVLLNQHRFAKLSDYGLSIVSEATRHNTVKLVTLVFCFCSESVLSGLNYLVQCFPSCF